MSFAKLAWVVAASTVLALGCSQGQGADDEGASEGEARVEDASGIALDFVSVQDSKPATTVEADQEMKTCETNVEYVQVSGTKNDAKVNAILKNGNTAPATCDEPQSFDSSATIKYVGKDTLVVAETGSYYMAGAAHPSFGITYKNVDLATGTLLTLDKILTPEAKQKLASSIRAQIGAKKTYEKGPDGKMVAQKLDPDVKASLLEALKEDFAPERGLDQASFAIAPGGVRIDLTNELPHAMQGTDDSVYLVKWKVLSDVMVPAMKQRFGVR